MSAVRRIAVGYDDDGVRLDRWFRRHFPELSHGRLEKLLRTGQVRVDGNRVKAGTRVQAGQEVRVPPLPSPAAAPPKRRPATPSPGRLADLKASILHLDDHVLAINKAPGLAVQGGTRTTEHLDAMLDGLRLGADERPRLVHRLDKDTSGVLLLGRTARAAAALAQAFKGKAAEKLYWAIVCGVPEVPRGRIDAPLAKRPGRAGERVQVDDEGKWSVTEFAILDRAGRRASWLALRPLTGRTHQIRAHCAAIGTPVLGDGKYGGREAFLPGAEVARRLHLHALAITVPHPAGGSLTVRAPAPAHFRTALSFFGFDCVEDADPFADDTNGFAAPGAPRYR